MEKEKQISRRIIKKTVQIQLSMEQHEEAEYHHKNKKTDNQMKFPSETEKKMVLICRQILEIDKVLAFRKVVFRNLGRLFEKSSLNTHPLKIRNKNIKN